MKATSGGLGPEFHYFRTFIDHEIFFNNRSFCNNPKTILLIIIGVPTDGIIPQIFINFTYISSYISSFTCGIQV